MAGWKQCGMASVMAGLTLMAGAQARGQVALPAVELEQPAEFAIYIDLEAASPEAAMATRDVLARIRQNAGGDAALDEELEARLEAYPDQWQAVRDTGLRQLVMLGGPDQEQMALLLRREAGTGVDELAAGLRGLAEMEWAAEDRHLDLDDVQVHELDDQWAYVSGPELGRVSAAGAGDAAAADLSALEAVLGEADGASMRFAFVMGEQGQQAIAQAQQDPNAMMMMGVIQPLESLEHGLVSVQLGDAPHIDLSMEFDDADAARAFAQELAGLVQMMGGMMAMMAQQPDAPDVNPQAVQQAMGRLAPQAEGTRVSRRINEALVAELADAGVFELRDYMERQQRQMQQQGPGGPAGQW
ncbi:MAG: hypothetical protein WD009_13800 [Phycisphaeraceae bacterium]